MTTVVDEPHRDSRWKASWTLEATSLSLELSIKPRQGAVTIHGEFGRVRGTIELGSDGRLEIRSQIDTSSFRRRLHAEDPRVVAHLRRALDRSGPAIGFDARGTAVPPFRTGRFRVVGQLTVGARHIPIEFDAVARRSDGALVVSARVPVDHRRLGLAWLPPGPLKAPTTLALRARATEDLGSRLGASAA
jgi:hypothetical protein